MSNTEIVLMLLAIVGVMWWLARVSDRASRDSGAGSGPDSDLRSNNSGGSWDSGNCHSDSGGGDCGGGGSSD